MISIRCKEEPTELIDAKAIINLHDGDETEAAKLLDDSKVYVMCRDELDWRDLLSAVILGVDLNGYTVVMAKDRAEYRKVIEKIGWHDYDVISLWYAVGTSICAHVIAKEDNDSVVKSIEQVAVNGAVIDREQYKTLISLSVVQKNVCEQILNLDRKDGILESWIKLLAGKLKNSSSLSSWEFNKIIKDGRQCLFMVIQCTHRYITEC